MKYKSYEDSAVQNTTGLNLELLGADDVISARTTNRPVINLYENQESDYNLLQTLLKTVYGNVNGIIPDILESFTPEDFSVGSFKNSTGNFFLRIPTGVALFRSDLNNEIVSSTDGNPFSKKGEYNYKDEIHKSSFLQDDLRSYVIENKPEINLYERELAKLIDLDLTDSTNDIKIYCDINKFVYKVAVLDEQTQVQKVDASGSPVFVIDENSNVVYKAQKNEQGLYIGEYDIEGINQETLTEIVYTNKENKNKPNAVNSYLVTDGAYTLIKKENGMFTSDVNKAEAAIDENDNFKYKTNYYMKVVRATSADDEITYLPNKKENASWEVCLPPLKAGKDELYKFIVNISDENNSTVEEFSFIVLGSGEEISTEDMNTKLYSNILSLTTKLTAERFTKNINSNIISGVKILTTSDNKICDKYKLTITKIHDATGNTEIIKDYINGTEINKISAKPKTDQKYYDNIFELTNAFLGYYSSYLIKIDSIYDYINLESIVKIFDTNSKHNIYYDLNADKDNGIKNEYDKTGRFIATPDNKTEPNFIKMFEVEFGTTALKPNTVCIKKVTNFLPTLDRRLIATKRAELNSLDVNARTELANYLHVKDVRLKNNNTYSNREIEMTEYADDEKNDQIRITSPVLRIVDKKDDVTDNNKENLPDTWEDSGNGDTVSDFYEDPTTVRNYDDNSVKYLKHLDSNNKGFIIDKNKGILLFNNDTNDTDGIHSYSSAKPIEIVSSRGNINLFRKGFDEPLYKNDINSKKFDFGRINIANIEDSKYNIVDVKGITRVRSKNDNQLVVRRIGDINNLEDKASIAFTVGQSNSNENETANDNTKDLFIGSLNFYSGDSTNNDPTSSENNKTRDVEEQNRFISFELSNTNEKEPKRVFTLRNAKSGNSKKIMTMYGDIVPHKTQDNFTIGFPMGSRSYNKSLTPVVPYYEKELESSLKVDDSGYSTEKVSNEGRWLASFIKRGYFGHITVADTEEDQIYEDSRNGNLRLNNSNIYDVSSIYINCDKTKERINVGTINFDNELVSGDKLTENTIYSRYDDKEDKGLISLILYRKLLDSPNANTDLESETNAAAATFSPVGTSIRKNLYVRRQTFLNESSKATTEDNSALVVKGQSVLKGELVVGKTDNVASVKYESIENVTANKSDDYKKYNWEYYGIGREGTYNNKVWAANIAQSYKDKLLFIFRNYGRSYFDGDITIDENSKFTENTTFNKSVVISNNNYADMQYNSDNSRFCPQDDKRYVKTPTFDLYYNPDSENKLPRHNTALNIVSGKVVFGSAMSTDSNDKSDFEVYGSQFIRRRLEIGTSKPSLVDTYETDLNQRLIYDGIVEDNSGISKQNIDESAKLYIEGGAQFNGDVVFGYDLKEVDYENPTNKIKSKIKCLRNHKPEMSDKYIHRPSKVIFWGANFAETEKNKEKDWNSDFDFHGKTLFDNTVRIGTPVEDVLRSDTFEGENIESGSLEIVGKDAPAALNVQGSVQVGESKSFTVDSKYIHLNGFGGDQSAKIELNSESGNNGRLLAETSGEINLKGYWISDKKIFTNEIKLNNEGTSITSFEKIYNSVGDNNSTLDNDTYELNIGKKNTQLKLETESVTLKSNNNVSLEMTDKTANFNNTVGNLYFGEEYTSIEYRKTGETSYTSSLKLEDTKSSLTVEDTGIKINGSSKSEEVKLIANSTSFANINTTEASLNFDNSYFKLSSGKTQLGYKSGDNIEISSGENNNCSITIDSSNEKIKLYNSNLELLVVNNYIHISDSYINIANKTKTSTINELKLNSDGNVDLNTKSNVGTFTVNGYVSIAQNLSVTGSISGTSLSVTGAVSGTSLSVTGAVSGTSLSVTGAVSGASLSVTGNCNCKSLTVDTWTFSIA